MSDEWKHKIFERDGYKCVYCGWDGSHDLRAYMLLEPDHIVPKDKDGSPDADNVVTSCRMNACPKVVTALWSRRYLRSARLAKRSPKRDVWQKTPCAASSRALSKPASPSL